MIKYTGEINYAYIFPFSWVLMVMNGGMNLGPNL